MKVANIWYMLLLR